MSDDELADRRNKLFFFHRLDGLFTQKPAHHLRSKTFSSKDELYVDSTL